MEVSSYISQHLYHANFLISVRFNDAHASCDGRSRTLIIFMTTSRLPTFSPILFVIFSRYPFAFIYLRLSIYLPKHLHVRYCNLECCIQNRGTACTQILKLSTVYSKVDGLHVKVDFSRILLLLNTDI